MNKETGIFPLNIESLRNEFEKLWLALLVKNTIDDLSRKMITTTSQEILDVINPLHKRFKSLWLKIVQNEIDLDTAKNRYSTIIEESNKKLEGKYKLVDPEDLLKRFEE